MRDLHSCENMPRISEASSCMLQSVLAGETLGFQKGKVATFVILHKHPLQHVKIHRISKARGQIEKLESYGPNFNRSPAPQPQVLQYFMYLEQTRWVVMICNAEGLHLSTIGSVFPSKAEVSCSRDSKVKLSQSIESSKTLNRAFSSV